MSPEWKLVLKARALGWNYWAVSKTRNGNYYASFGNDETTVSGAVADDRLTAIRRAFRLIRK